jgi:hypothetical protein
VTRTFRDGHAETWWAADAGLVGTGRLDPPGGGHRRSGNPAGQGHLVPGHQPPPPRRPARGRQRSPGVWPGSVRWADQAGTGVILPARPWPRAHGNVTNRISLSHHVDITTRLPLGLRSGPSRLPEGGGIPAEGVADLELVAAHARVVDFQRPVGRSAGLLARRRIRSNAAPGASPSLLASMGWRSGRNCLRPPDRAETASSMRS